MTPGRRARNQPFSGPAIVAALVAVGLVVGIALAFALRGGSGGSISEAPASSAPVASGRPSAVESGGSSTAGSGASASASGGPSSVAASASLLAVTPPASGTRARIDPSVLSILPPTVGELPVREFTEAEQQAAGDPNLGQNVVRFATAFVGDAKGANWAYVAVVELRPGAGTDAFYRDWRDTFDTSACQQAGGVAGHSTIEIAGRSVERANCGSGVRTYHVLIAGTSLLVSVSDFGDGQFGQLVLEALRP